MMPRFLYLLLLISALLGCGAANGNSGPVVQDVVLPVAPSATATVEVEPTLGPEFASTSVNLVIWGPENLAPSSSRDVQSDQQPLSFEGFEALHPNIQVSYHPKLLTGPAGLASYLRSASAVAPTTLPDLIVLPTTVFAEVAQTGLLLSLDAVIDEAVRDDLYPFAVRDTQANGNWISLPLAVQVEHGVIRTDTNSASPRTIEGLLRENAPVWLFAGQARAEGEMSNALLLQLLAAGDEMLAPGMLPEEGNLVSLLATLHAAQERGTVPHQVLQLSDERLLFDRLESEEANLIESGSRQYLLERASHGTISFAPLPTLTGESASVVDGYLLALTTSDPRRQAAAAEFLEWFLDPMQLADWSRVTGWLPARRSALDEAVQDESYRAFVDELLETGWLRPSGAEWRVFAQAVQEQFEGVMRGSTSPPDAVNYLISTFVP